MCVHFLLCKDVRFSSQNRVNDQTHSQDLHCWAAASSWRVSQKRMCVSCCISWAQSRCRSVCLSLSHTHTQTHTHGHKLGTQAGIHFLLFIKHKSQQTMPNQWAGLIDKRLQWDTSEQRAQTEQIGGEKSETIIQRIQAHLRSLLRTNTHVFTFTRPSLMGWAVG